MNNTPSFQMSPSSIAIPFITFDNAKKKFIISPEAKAVIGNPSHSKVGVISLVGKYRTGKSFLLNRVLINRKTAKGFDVGPTIRPCTKGIWLWSDPIYLQNTHSEEAFPAFLIDTEGLGAYDEEVNHDSKIFLIAILISSLFIYNSFGTIDETAINSLSLILHLSKAIKLRNSSSSQAETLDEEEEISKYFPSLLWLLRDFALKLEDSEGNVITAKQYLENALQLQKGSSDKIEEKNQVRKLIKTYFSERDCFLMVRPVEKENELQQLESLPDEMIRKEFLDQAEVLRNKVLKKTKPKTFNGKTLSGGMLLELVESIISSINEGTIPVIENTWKYVISTECIRAINGTIEEYRHQMKQFQQENYSHINIFNELDKFSIQVSKELIDQFSVKNSSFEDSKDYIEKLRLRLIEEKKKITEENSKLIEDKYTNELDKEISFLLNDKDKLSNQTHSLFIQELIETKDKLDSLIPEFPMKKGIVYDKTINAIKKYIDLYWVKSKQDADKTISKLNFDIGNLNKKISEITVEWLADKAEQKQIIDKLNDSVIENKLREKSLEEKIKNYENDKRLMKESSERAIQNINKEFEAKFDTLTLEKNKLCSEIKGKEEELLIAKLNFDKVIALKEQKCLFQEKEIQTWRDRFNALIKDLSDSKSEYSDLQLQNEQLRDEATSYQSQLAKYELNQSMVSSIGFGGLKGNINSSNIAGVGANALLNTFIKEQSEENKRIKELLNKILTTSSMLINNNKELTSSNQTLALTLANYEDNINSQILNNIKSNNNPSQANTNLNANVKPYEHSLSSPQLSKPKLTTKVSNGTLSKDDNGKPYIEYTIDIEYNGKNWKVNKRFNQFSILSKAIKNLFKDIVQLPDSGSLFVNINDMTGSHEAKVLQLDKYLRELSCIECVIQSHPFKNFLDIDDSNNNVTSSNSNCNTDNSISTSYKKESSVTYSSTEELSEETIKKTGSGRLNGNVKKITVEKKQSSIKSTSPVPSKKNNHLHHNQSTNNNNNSSIPIPSNNKKVNMIKTQPGKGLLNNSSNNA